MAYFIRWPALVFAIPALLGPLVFLVQGVVVESTAAEPEAEPVFERKWGSSGSGDGQMINPFGVAVDGFGNVYVADYGNDRIQKFASTGALVLKVRNFRLRRRSVRPTGGRGG